MNNIAFFTTRLSFNQISYLNTVNKMLKSNFILHLIVPKKYLYFKIEGFNMFGYSKLEYIEIRKYIKNNRIKFISNIIDFPLHCLIILLITYGLNVKIVCRVAGEVFGLFRLSNNCFHKLKMVILNEFLLKIFHILGNYNFFDNIILMGDRSYEIFHNKGFSNIIIINRPIDIDYFKMLNKKLSRKRCSICDKDKIVMTVGRIEYLKGLYTIVDMLKHTNFDKLTFLIIGEIKDHKLVNLLKKFDNLKVLGPISPKKLIYLYNAADLLIHPSLTEGIPTVALEAMACGLPVIATDVGETPILSPPAILFHPGDWRKLSSEICKFFNMDKNKMEDIGGKCRKKIEREFSIQALKQKYINIFYQL